MESIKTAISIKKPLFDQVNLIANDLHISRSHLFSIAVAEFIERHKNQELLTKINDAYCDLPEINNKTAKQMRPKHYKMVKDQW
ncbi:CopG family transcriptional regulator [bacterium]|nr:CopG family transcriptional regulator [bacterium]